MINRSKLAHEQMNAIGPQSANHETCYPDYVVRNRHGGELHPVAKMCDNMFENVNRTKVALNVQLRRDGGEAEL
jgi:hypothetical protein